MDNYIEKQYLASRQLKDANNFYLNINFEVLSGCKWKCQGCHVGKEQQDGIPPLQIIRFNQLLNDFEDSGYKPFIAFIAPTDFLSADNTIYFLRNFGIIQLLHHFKRLSLQTTYLDVEGENVDQIVDCLNEHYSDMELEINIVIEPSQIMNEKYLDKLAANKESLRKRLHKFEHIRQFGIFNVYDYSATKIAAALQDYDFLHNKINHLFETTIDYNFSLGRREDLTGEEFEKTVLQISEMFDDAISGEKVKFLRFSFGKLTDSLVEKQYNYRNGKFFSSPLLYERFVSFKDEFEIPVKDWKAREFEQWEHDIQTTQYANVYDKEECGDCQYLGSCVDRGVLHLMDTFGITKCVVAKDALDAINFKRSTIESNER